MLKKIDADRIATLVGAWLAEQEIGVLARSAVDGKVLRGSGRHDGKPLQLLSAVIHHLPLTLGQIPIEDKSKQITPFDANHNL